MRWSVIAVVGVGCGFGLTEDNAVEVAAREYCRKDRICDTAFWDDSQNDRARCEIRREDQFQLLVDVANAFGRDVDLDELDACLGDLRSATCEDYEANGFSNDCDDVFDG